MSTFLKKNGTLFLVIGVAMIAFALGYFGSQMFSLTDESLGGAAGAMADQVGCDLSPLASQDPTGIVLADPLNLRTGPGLNYQVITMLDFCTPVRLLGRSSDRAWLEVRLPGNLGGWVFAGYIQANVKVADLTITTAAGGPLTSSVPGPLDASVIIQANQVAAFVTGMPANTMVSATLNPTGGSGKAILVASGLTDGAGNITLTFPMPNKWADGTVIQSGTMTLTFDGGGTSLTAFLTYFTN
jgi:uncharacterized protein YraI